MLLKILLIPMLVKVTLVTGKPHLASIIYVAAMFTNSLMFDLAFGQSVDTVALQLVMSGVVSYGFFRGLNEFESSPLYWLVLVLGIPALVLFG